MRRPTGIRRNTLKMILGASADMYPNEFGAILRVDEDAVIAELLLLPGTVSGRQSALFQLHMLPPDFDVVGTVHSHPSGACYPSDEDLHLWSKFGGLHLITGHPYGMENWAAFDFKGTPLKLEVVGVRRRR